MSESSKTELIYGDSGEGASFMSRSYAEFSIELRRGLKESRTWGELESKIDAHSYSEALERSRSEEDDSEPAPDDAFTASSIWGYEEGDWPEFPARETEVWVDDDLIYEYGAWVEPRLNEPYAVIIDNVEVVADLLRERGHVCTRDDDLVWKACYGG